MKTSQNRTQAERLREVSRLRREQGKDELRRAILDAAGGLFLEHGYEGISMRQIAERIGYSATTIYRYYEDKDDLLFAIVQEGFERFGSQLVNAAGGHDDLWGRLQALGQAYIEFGLKNPVYYQLMFMQRFDFLFEHRPRQEAPVIDSFGVLRQAVEEAMRAGVLKPGDAETTSTVIWAVVHGITSLAIADSKRFSERQVQLSTELGLRMIYEGLRVQ